MDAEFNRLCLKLTRINFDVDAVCAVTYWLIRSPKGTCTGTTEGATGSALVTRWEKDPEAQRPNLLKKGIILVKAWCYYEARVLGAHHSLLSSYALEVMVLYVLQHYHRRTRTPFALLVTYLQVFSAFDWSTYGLTLHGPIPLTQIGSSPPGAFCSLAGYACFFSH